jgi:SAM-dependent methyltransferase
MTAAPSLGARYQAEELHIFAEATRWKEYWASHIASFVKGDVLEVGAGIGANARFLRPLSRGRYLSLEPDAILAQQIESSPPMETFVGVVSTLPREEQFDTALYIDVLEHIEDDAAELAEVVRHVRPGGHIVVLSPATEVLYSPFDKAIGHCRRYTRASLLRCSPPGASVVRVDYLDCLGWVLSFANRVLLRQRLPTLGQVLFWDRRVVPASRRLDALTGFQFGKSIVGVWQVTT